MCSSDLSFTESASNFALRVPADGVDGTLLWEISIGATERGTKLTFSSESHSSTTLPALRTCTSNAVAVGGVNPTIRIWGDQAINWKVQSSTDLTNWTDTTEGSQTLSSSTLTWLNLTERHDFIRFVVTTNANTTDTILDARAIY